MLSIGKAINQAYEDCAQKYSFKPTLILEPGRYLIDNGMIVIGRVTEVKQKSIYAAH